MDQPKKTDDTYESGNLKSMLALAIPISIQSLFQYSLSVIDQVMVGQLGTNSVAAVGLGSNFPNVFIVTLAAIGTSASIMIAQFFGIKDKRSIRRAFFCNSLLALLVTLLFFIPSFALPKLIISLYTFDTNVIPLASNYLQIIAPGYLFLLITVMISALLRNTGKAKIPMMTGIISVALNTLLNYVLIFGRLGFPALGIIGTAVATTLTRFIESVLLILFLYFSRDKAHEGIEKVYVNIGKMMKQTIRIAAPVVLNEFLWGVGSTVYSIIYGRIGTEDMAAMTLTNPVQSLLIGLFSGFSTAAAILVGNCLGRNDFTSAYYTAIKILKFSIICSAAAGGILILSSNIYVHLFHVEPDVQKNCIRILYVFASLLCIKVGNMIVAGGILRCGGKTRYSLYLDLLGTWCIGIPLGLLAAVVFKLDIQWVYLAISVEEVIRFILGIGILRSKRWMNSIAQPESAFG